MSSITDIDVVSSYTDFEALRAALQIPEERLVQAAGIPFAVLRERRLEGCFNSAESCRLTRFSDLFHNAAQALESEVAASSWLTRPGPRFGGLAPLEFAATKSGYQEMCDIVEHVADDGFG